MASFTPQKQLADLAKDMEGKDSLGDYDVLVSYNQDILNEILLQRATEIGPITSKGLEWVDEGKDDWGVPISTTVKLNLQKPSLQISDGDGRILFTVSMTGSKTTTRKADGKSRSEDFTNLKVVITTSLSSVHGTMNKAGDFTPHPSSTPASAGAVVIMEPNQDVTVGTCINFSNLLSVSVENDKDGTSSNDNLDRISALVKAKIERRFKEAGLQYCLAAVNNKFHPPEKDDAFVLQPASFTFRTVRGENNTSALCIGILLKDNPNAGPQAQMLEFAPNGKLVNPIPSERTASIIFSHRVMANCFLVPGLEKTSKNVKCISRKGEPGMKFTFNLPSYQVTAPSVSTQEKGMGTQTDFYMDGFSFNTDDADTTLTLASGRASAPFDLLYKSTSQAIGWTKKSYIPRMPTDRSSGTANTKFLLSGTGSWGLGADTTKHPNEIQVLFTFDSEFKAELDQKSYEGWQRAWYGKPYVPPQIVGLHPAVPQISFPVAPLDYFLTTNLLFPGEHIFHADDPGKTTDKQGIMSPRDTILTGTIRRAATAVSNGSAH